MSTSELLLFAGIAAMAAAVLGMAAGALIFLLTGRRLKKKLEQEYGRMGNA